MGKMMTFLVIVFAMSALLFVSGISSQNENNALGVINQLIDGNSPEQTDIYIKIGIAISIIVGTAAVASVFGNAGVGIVAGSSFLVLFLINFVSDFLFVLNKAKDSCDPNTICSNWVYYALYVIFIPIIIGYIWGLYEFVTGDN